MSRYDHTDELNSLLLDWEDGTLDQAGVGRLRELLKTSAEAREQYVRLQMINAALKFDDEAGILQGDAAPDSNALNARLPIASTQDRPAWRPRRWMLIVALLIICIQAGRLVQL